MKIGIRHLMLATALSWSATSTGVLAQSAQWYVLSEASCIARDNHNYPQAERMLAEALREAETCGPESAVPPTLNKLAVVYLSDNKPVQAELFFMRAIDVTERLNGPDDAQLAANLTSLGTLYLAQKKYRAAEPLLKRALEITNKNSAANDSLVGSCACNLADLYFEQGKYTEAEILARAAIETQEKNASTDRQLMSVLLENLSQSLQAQKKESEALTAHERSLSYAGKSVASIDKTGAAILPIIANQE